MSCFPILWQVFSFLQAAHFAVSKPDSLADEAIELSVHGLPPSSKITLRSEVVVRHKFRFSAFGFHHTDSKGSLLTSHDPSVGGTYMGVDPMGLIWSLQPAKGERRGLRYLPDVLVPSEIKLSVYRGHKEESDDTEKLAETTIRRHFISDDVSFEHVRHGRVRGILFRPKDKSRKYPGLVDVYGSGGGVMAHRAALLASKGFVTLALAFFRYEDLPKRMFEIDMDYFLEAVDYLRQLESVNSCGVGVVGISKGADLIVDVAVLSPHVKATAFINGFCFTQFSKLFFKDEVYRVPTEVDWTHAYEDENKNIVCKDCHIIDEFPASSALPVERIHGKIGFFVSGDDLNLPSLSSAQFLMEKMKKNGREEDSELHLFDGAGHLLEPPFLPHCAAQYMPHMGGHVVAYGGTPAAHKEAQLRFWRLLVDFLRRNLEDSSAALKARL